MEVRVHVTPGSRKEVITRVDDNTFTIKVREKAEGNRANLRTREIVAEVFSVPVSRARMVRGHRGQNKIIQIT